MGRRREYIVRYAKARGISEDEAFKHEIVKEVCENYSCESLSAAKLKQAKEKIHAGRNGYNEEYVKPRGY